MLKLLYCGILTVPLQVCHLISWVLFLCQSNHRALVFIGGHYLKPKMNVPNCKFRRQRPANGSPANCSKEKRDKGTFVCPVCLENIVEGTKTKPGQDAVYCEGICDTWLHRKCVGLSKTTFANLDINVPYICPHCQLHTQEIEIVSLKNTIETLTKTID